jgi:hypothetical protein
MNQNPTFVLKIAETSPKFHSRNQNRSISCTRKTSYPIISISLPSQAICLENGCNILPIHPTITIDKNYSNKKKNYYATREEWKAIIKSTKWCQKCDVRPMGKLVKKRISFHITHAKSPVAEKKAHSLCTMHRESASATTRKKS